jgi:Na+/H+-dicarboxylate symporter
MAAGIPIEAVVIVDTIESVPDVFQTVLNVTGYMSAATLLSRSSRAPRRARAAASAGPAQASEIE